MIKINTCNLQDKLEVSWFSRNNFYRILEVIKGTVGAMRDGRSWFIEYGELNDLLVRLGIVRDEMVLVDMKVINFLFGFLKKKENTLAMRNSLDGVECDVKLNNGFSLLPFQKVGVEFMYLIRNGIIADTVGLGKTIQAMCVGQRMLDDALVERVIVLVPSSLKVKWYREIKKFLPTPVILADGNKSDRLQKWRDWQSGKYKFLVMSMDSMKFDYESYLEEYNSKRYLMIIDEIQDCRNPSTKRSESVRVLGKNAKCFARLGLSATYVETGLEDLFGVMLIIDKTVFGDSKMRFESLFINRDWFGKLESYKNVSVATEKMKYYSVRRNKEMVKNQLNAFLPKVNEVDHWIELTKDQLKLQNDIVKKTCEILSNMEKSDKINITSALTEMGYLRQVAITSELIDPSKASSNKIKLLTEDIIKPIIEENKVVIFCFYTKFIDIMEREFKSIGIDCMAMHGKREEGNSKNRQKMIDLFSASNKVQVLLTSDILAKGVDIPAASYVINTDILWNPAKMIQRCGRIDRLNQQSDNIYNINIWSKGSIEEQIYHRLFTRKELAAQVIDAGQSENRFKKITLKDLKGMLRNMGGRI